MPSITLFLLICLPSALFPLTAQYLFTFGQDTGSPGALERPAAIVCGSDNSIYVTDAGRGGVLKYSPEGRFLGEAGGAGRSGRLGWPAGITRRTGFGLFVCDLHYRELVQINEDLSVLSTFSLDDKAPDNAFTPFAIAASREGVLYTVDPSDGDVLVLERDNRIFPLIGNGKANPLVALKPRALAILTRLYMNDTKTGRIYAFDRFGTFLQSFGDSLSVPDFGLAACGDSLLGVADTRKRRIILFSETGREAGAFTTFDASGDFSPGAFCENNGCYYILKQDPPAIVVLRVRF